MDCKKALVPQRSIQNFAPIHFQDIRPICRLVPHPIRGELESIQSPATETSDLGTAASIDRKMLKPLCRLEDQSKFLAYRSMFNKRGKSALSNFSAKAIEKVC